MKLLTNYAFLLSIAFAFGCQSPKNTEQKTEPQETQISASPEVALALTVVNPNLATEEELITSGLSASLVTQVIENRPFLTMNDLDGLLVDMDSASKEALYANVFVPFNLNTTAEADFKMIPGVGNRMAHEFDEYRPYLKLEQFRREIGKYVDDAEVARYEQYVFVPIELNTATEEDILALPGVGKRMAHEFDEYRPYKNIEQFRKEIGKYVDDKELSRLERFVYLAGK